jgi:hypothetical protein
LNSRRENKKKQQKHNAANRKAAIADQAASQEAIKGEPQPKHQEVAGENGYSMHKPPDSILALWGALLGVAVALIYLLQLLNMQSELGILQRDQRAWLKIDIAAPWKEPRKRDQAASLLQDMDYVWLPLIISNTGKIPAKQIDVRGVTEIHARVEESDLAYHPAFEHVTSKVVFPNDSFPFEANMYEHHADTDTNSFHKLTGHDRAELLSGESYMMVYARAIYNDAFGEHWVKFCGSIMLDTTDENKPYQARNCGEYNDTGDGPMPK